MAAGTDLQLENQMTCFRHKRTGMFLTESLDWGDMQEAMLFSRLPRHVRELDSFGKAVLAVLMMPPSDFVAYEFDILYHPSHE